MPSLFYAGQPDYIEKLNTLATAASMTNGTVAASFLSLAVTGTATAASFVGPLTGNASTATTLATARNINGVSFNGSADITVTAAAGTLTGATLAAGVTASSLTSVGTLTALTVSGTSTLGITRVSGADNSLQFGVSGATRGVRFNTSSFGSAIEGVDNTLVGSYQPLNVMGSALGLYTTTTGNVQIGTNAGSSISLVVPHVASVVNYARILGGATGTAVGYGVDGTDASINWAASSKGSSPIALYTNNFSQLQVLVNHAASAVNYASVTGAATDNAVRYGVGGSDSNIAWAASSKGSSPIALYTNNFSQLQVLVNHAASAVNYASVTGAATDNAVRYGVDGSDSNIAWAASSKGSSPIALYTNNFSQLQVLVNHAASAVNYASVTGAATDNAVRYGVGGSDSNIAWAASSKGTFGLGLYTNNFTNLQFAVSHTASAVNWPVISGSATGNAVTISTNGTDANRSISLTAAGTGLVQITNDSLRIVTSKTPASAAATGTQGQISWDADYIYVCTANNTWKRAALATW